MVVEEVKENPLSKRGPGRPKAVAKPAPAVAVAKPAVVAKVVEKPEIGDDDEVKLTGRELKALKDLLTQKESNQEGIVAALVTALRESRKPYKSEADAENERRQRDQMRNMIRNQIRQREVDRLRCEHMAGVSASSDVPHPANAFTAIVWHDITNSLRWGICSTCQREFWPTDTDYRYWRSKRSFNTPSKAGDRDGVDTQKFIEEQHPEPFGTVTGVDPVVAIRQKLIPVF